MQSTFNSKIVPQSLPTVLSTVMICYALNITHAHTHAHASTTLAALTQSHSGSGVCRVGNFFDRTDQ